jgi:hypothetical protein
MSSVIELSTSRNPRQRSTPDHTVNKIRYKQKLLIARYRALFPTQSSGDALFDKGFSGSLNRHATDMQSLLNLLIGPSRALWALIGLQKNAGSRQFVSCGFPFGDHSEEVVSFLID